jgi:hypothetical protein
LCVFVAETKSFFQRAQHGAIRAAYGVAVAWFLLACAQFYLPGRGFTYLIQFGDRDAAHYIAELRAIDHYEIPDSGGYDAQHYAQLAMHPQLGDPALRDAIDSLPYRARRILFCWTAYALALGDPARALQIYALQNIACWLVLGVLLLRWFPAVNWGNFARWAGVMFSFGLCFSVRGSLVDGPSLLLIAGAVALLERGRPWWAAALLGVSGLGKETNVLAAGALVSSAGFQPAPGERQAGSLRYLRLIPRLALVALPLALWLVTLKLWLGEAMNAGYRNFALPFVAYIGKWREVIAGLGDPREAAAAQSSALLVIALTAQFLFFALRPRWRETWWRVGAAYALLMAVLGEAVWEGYPGAASRVLLPMTLAFNILVPRGLRWWPVLLLGNLTLLLAPATFEAPTRESFEVIAPRELRVAADQRAFAVQFDAAWYGPERSRFEVWRWSRGPAAITLTNPQPDALRADIAFELRAQQPREVSVRLGERELWRGAVAPGAPAPVSLRAVLLPPGATTLQFNTDLPAASASASDPRLLAFAVRNLEVRLKPGGE